MKSIIVGYLIFLSFSATALVPVEGILLGEAVSEYQQDPLSFIFSDIYDKTQAGENAKFRLYQNTVNRGIYFQEACGLYTPATYATPWLEKQARRSMAANLQYIGLDTSIKALGAYGERFKLTEEAYKTLTTNLVTNYCSKNITVFSIRRIKEALDHYYKNPVKDFIPSVENSPFMSSVYKTKTESTEARSNEFDQAISTFKAFCSWGGDVSDYRLMVPYLKNNTIMAFVIQNMSGVQDKFDPVLQKIETKPSEDTVQVGCNDLICRKVTNLEFKKSFPLSIGSTGLTTDLYKLFCHHFKLQEYSSVNTVPEVKNWIKKMELEDPIFETSFFISLMTGVPDAVFGVESYRDLPAVAKSSIDDRWGKWSKDTLKYFSQDMLFEESLKIKTLPIRDNIKLRTEGFHLDFSVTLGEMDRIVDENDKLALSFDITFSKNYLRHILTKWNHFSDTLDLEGRDKFKEDLSRQVEAQLKTKERYFRQKMWNDEFSRLIVQELVGQLLIYNGPLFNSYEEKMIKIPVKFSYGIFALSYLRYRADVKAGRLKLNL